MTMLDISFDDSFIAPMTDENLCIKYFDFRTKIISGLNRSINTSEENSFILKFRP